MDVKEQCADGREGREAYAMLMEPDTITREQRTLRREICISRIIIFTLLITCMTFCVLLYIQQCLGDKNNKIPNKENANESYAESLTGGRPMNLPDVETPPIASLTINSTEPNLTWKPHHRHMNDNFCLKEACEFLTIPRAGRYRLGLQITYTESHLEKEPTLLHHQIFKHSKGYKDPISILSIFETIHQKKPWYKSIFSEVIDVFDKSDKIKVNISHPALVDIAGKPWTKNFLTIQYISRISDE